MITTAICLLILMTAMNFLKAIVHENKGQRVGAFIDMCLIGFVLITFITIYNK